MSAYVRQLQEAVQQIADEAASQRDHASEAAARERLSPLKDRLIRLLATIPNEVQREGLALPALQAALRGRHRGTCHPGELGTALRSLGFTRSRIWKGAEGFSARWVRSATD